MFTTKSILGLNRGLTSKFWRLKSINNVKFTEENMMRSEKHVLVKESLQRDWTLVCHYEPEWKRQSMDWFVLVLWHINHFWLFNVKSYFYIYIKYIWFGLVGFYGISTLVGYLMPNPLYTYILNIYDLQTHFVDAHN